MFFTANIAAQKKQKLTMQWTVAAELPVAENKAKALGVAGAVTGIHKHKLIIAGGANFPAAMPWLGGKKNYEDALYVYAKKGDGIVLQQQAKLPFTIAYAASCTTEKGIVVAGGENENGLSNKTFLLQLTNNASVFSIQHLPDLPFAVTNASIAVNGQHIYLAGGEMTNGVSDQLLELDLNNLAAGWKQLSTIAKQISHAVLLINKHTLYVIGGRKRNSNGISTLYNSVSAFDLLTKQWTEKKSVPYALSAGTGAVYKNQLLIFGGDKGETFHRTEELIAAINAAADEATKKKLTDEKTALQSAHPGFSKEILAYNIINDSWDVIDSIPYATPVTTTAVKWNNCFFIPSGEIKAGIRSSFILSVKPVTRK
jgi:N-acetylneuraminic acid mutarotase